MTLSDANVIRRLRDRYVCGWRNIEGKEAYAGRSNKHGTGNPAVETTNGAGHHNVQMLFFTSRGRVLHGLPGYWEPAALMSEMDFVLELDALDRRTDLPAREKAKAFARAHLDHIEAHTRLEIAERSGLQPFDRAREASKAASDFFLDAAGGGAAGANQRTRQAAPACGLAGRGGPDRPLKTVDRVVHERMAKRPFRKWNDFDVAAFIDMGVVHYDAGNDGCPRRLTTCCKL